MRQQSLKTRLRALNLFTAAILFIVGGTGYWSMKKSSEAYNKIAELNFPAVQDLDAMAIHFRQIRIDLRTIGMQGVQPLLVESSIERVKSDIAAYEAAAASYAAVPHKPDDSGRYQKVESEWGRFKSLGQRIIGLATSRESRDHDQMLHLFLVDCPSHALAFDQAMDDLIAFQNKEAKSWIAQAEDSAAFGNKLSLILVLAGFLVSTGISFWFSERLSNHLRDLALRLSGSAEVVSERAVGIGEVSESLSQNVTSQASSLTQTAAAVEQSMATIHKNNENTRRSQEVSGQSRNMVLSGQKTVGEMIESIRSIADANNAIVHEIDLSYDKIGEIVTLIEQIGDKTRVINDIVFQTKLLSFNASVEAARAGEQGKGFSVVAEEIGNLARMSGSSAREISQLLDVSGSKVKSIIAETKDRVHNMAAAGIEKVKAGSTIAERCGEVLEEIVKNTGQVEALTTQIATASHEQASGINEINQAMNQLSGLTEQNTSTSVEASSSASELKHQAIELRDCVGELLVELGVKLAA